MTGPAPGSGARRWRVLGLCCLALLVAAGLFGGAAGAGSPSGGGLALFALAGVAALVALTGPARRGIGGLLAVGGVLGAVVGAGPPNAGGLAVAGGVVLAGTGLAVLVVEPRLSRFGARYSDRAHRPPPDADRAAWDALDAGFDPTAATTAATTASTTAAPGAEPADEPDRDPGTTPGPVGDGSVAGRGPTTPGQPGGGPGRRAG